MTLAEAGKRNEALQVLEDIKANAAHQYVSPTEIAGVYAVLGDREHALQWLEQGWQDQSEMLLYLRVYPPFSSLRGDPRFQELVRKVGVGQ